MCNVACNANETCSNGACTPVCSGGQVLCNSQCIDPMTNATFCGASGDCMGSNAGTTCGSTQTCTGGQCTSGTCRTVAGITWCYHPTECGKACNDTCAAFGKTPKADKTAWFNAQNTSTKCQAISNAFGIKDTVNMGGYTYACLEDSNGPHQPGVLRGGLLCSTYSGCPNQHVTNMDQKGTACSSSSRISICPCE